MLLPFLALLPTQIMSFENDFDNILGTANLTTKTARFDSSLLDLFASSDGVTPVYKACHENPWRVPYFAEAMKYDLLAQVGSASETLRAGSKLIGIEARRSLNGSPIESIVRDAQAPDSLTKTLTEMQQSGLIQTVPSVTAIPMETQNAAALMLKVLNRSVGFRRLAVKNIPKIDEAFTFVAASGHQELEGEPLERMLSLRKQFDVSYMAAAAHDIFLATDQAAEWLKRVPPTTKYAFTVETTWGTVNLSGGSDDTHAEKSALLIIDTGGKDTYLNHPRTSSASNWASIVIDSAGNDSYLSNPVLDKNELASFADRKTGGAMPGPGGSLFGITYLKDLQGDDLYRTHRPGIGSARYGFAYVSDVEGNDIYDAYQDSEGFGEFGAGFLVDQAGSDLYRCFRMSQGAGSTGGLGYLMDRSGDDDYLADNSTLDFPSSQDVKNNESMSQGFGGGRRADFSDGHSLPGGVGILFDAAGTDRYRAGIFAQGSGYWQGTGMLWESDGNDTYEAIGYAQGAASHFGVGYLYDEAGNDKYSVGLTSGMGSGYDFGLGMLLDKSGDDQYRGSDLCLGAGNSNGIGAFMDLVGNDDYAATGTSLGKANGAPKFDYRTRALCLGSFMDLGGVDKYPENATYAGNARRQANWAEKMLDPSESQLGIFFDR